MNAVHLAGVTPTSAASCIAPHLGAVLAAPAPASASRAAAGAARLLARSRAASASCLEVGGVPRGARGVTAWADGRAVAHRASGGDVVFTLAARRERAADWAVTWR